MSDNASYGEARSYLSSLQMQTYQSLGIAPQKQANPSELREFVERWMRSQYAHFSPEELTQNSAELAGQLLQLKQCGPFEDPMKLMLMQDLAADIEKACGAREYPLNTRPVLGTLPTGQVNALTVWVPGTDEHLVLFDPMLFEFALLLSKAVAQSFPASDEKNESFSTGREEVEKWLRGDRRAIERFREVVIAYAVTGVPGSAPSYFPESHYAVLAYIVCQAMELFVMGHEYGHVILGHLTDPITPVAENANEQDAISYSWLEEYAADEIGLSLSIQAMHDSEVGDLPLAITGANVFFRAISIMDETVSILAVGEDRAFQLGSHPPAELRKLNLQKMLAKGLGDSDAKAAQELAEGFDNALDLLWAETKPFVQELHRQGVRPAATWSQRRAPQT